jgi:hypothetical protein
MKYGIYPFYRFLFGVYLIWLGIYNLDKMESNSNFVKISIEGYTEIFAFLKNSISALSIDYLNYKIPEFTLNTTDFLNSSNEIVFIMNYALVMGGILCALGYKVSKGFILIGILLNVALVHNVFYFANEKMKVNVLKMLAVLGGVLHVI